MNVTKNLKHYTEYHYDFSVDGGATGVHALSSKNGFHALPLGSVVTSVAMRCVAAITAAGSCAISYGNTTDADGYSGAAVDFPSLVAKDAVKNGWDNSAALIFDTNHPKHYPVVVDNDANFNMTVATSAITAGKLVFMVEFIAPSV